jgi:hypothetical protein
MPGRTVKSPLLRSLLVRRCSRLPRGAAAGRVADLSTDGALNLAGLQSVLDLRIQFALMPSLGPSLSPYYDPAYYDAALGR